MDPKITIIIPVYNVEAYLPQCLNSIIAQTFKDWECILVDDGSKDGSGSICDEFVRKDSRFRAIYKGNGGVSSARNEGLKYAKGEWVFFSDSDDILLANCLETLFSGTGNDIDLVESGYSEIKFNKTYVTEFTSNVITISGLDYVNLFFFDVERIYRGYHGYPWNKIIRKSVIEDNNITFNQSISFKEDCLFLIQYSCVMKGMAAILPGIIYNHILRGEGATYRYKTFSKLTTSRVDAVIEIYKTIHSRFGREPVDYASKKDVAFSLLEAIEIARSNNQLKNPILSECKNKVTGTIGKSYLLRVLLIKRFERFFHYLNPMTYFKFIKRKIK